MIELTDTVLKEEITQFIQQQQTLMIASLSHSLSTEKWPLASYAPFVENKGDFYLLLSDLAHHSDNLKQHQATQCPLSILLIEDEKNTRNLFARKRLSYSCNIQIVSRKNQQWQQNIDLLHHKLGSTVSLLSSLTDFNLYCLHPILGHYIRGFGQAYTLEFDDNQQLNIRPNTPQ
jgi:putative heme iron utilization protein